MKPKHQRMIFLAVSIAIMVAASSVILYTFRENLVFFFTPTQLYAKIGEGRFNPKQEMRLGGLVKAGSIIEREDGSIRFTVTDLTREIDVEYRGLLPALFREGQGVVALGTLQGSHVVAREILAKHDENYMPKEVADALKQSGQWKPE
ncbi:MAG: cytochrome c maturation protein CcmE [Alphaproteobacteria bacterium]|nr:cytochrome c maturation protein CcmE [Alphaproteobacteria bacterium]